MESAGHPKTARWLATSAIASQANRFPDCLPSPPAGPRTDGLDARDAALAHAIYEQVVRRWLTLAALIDLHCTQPFAKLEATMKAVLLGGAAQLVFFDRVPAHAALDESVEVAKSMIRPGAGGMVNAVLRRVADLMASSRVVDGPWDGRPDAIPLSDGRVRTFGRPVLGAARGANAPDAPGATARGPTTIDLWSQGVSLPASLLEDWSKRFGIQEAKRQALHSIIEPPIVLNTLAVDRSMSLDSSLLKPHAIAGSHVYIGPSGMLARAIDQGAGRIWVQDAGSASAVREVRGRMAVRSVADICAGGGTKTAQLLHAFPDAMVIASDIDLARTEALAKRFRDEPRARVVRHAELASECASLDGGGVDLLLMDVPCSNTGVLPRRPEARYRAGEAGQAQFERLVQTQREIARLGERLLSRRGGWLLYSTCSLQARENEEQVAWLLGDLRARERSAALEAGGNIHLPKGLPGDDPATYADGSFWALVRVG